MKKRYFIAAMLGVLLAMGSCTDDLGLDTMAPQVVPPAPQQGELVISAGMPGDDEGEGDGSRVAYDDLNLKLTWEESDGLTLAGYDGEKYIGSTYLMIESGEGTTRAQFKGNPVEGATHYVAYYTYTKGIGDASKLNIDSKGVARMDYSGQTQMGENPTGHIKQYLHLESALMKVEDMTGQGAQLEMKNSIIRFDVTHLPAGLTGVDAIMWQNNVGTELGCSASLNLQDVGQGPFSAYMCFDGMDVYPKCGFCVQMMGGNKIFHAEVASVNGKKYRRGARSVAQIDTKFSWEEVKVPDNEIWMRTADERMPDFPLTDKQNVEYMVHGPNRFGYFVAQRKDLSAITSLDIDYGINSEIEAVLLPDGMQELTKTFWGCQKLSFVKLPQQLRTIGNQCFYLCSSLGAVSLPQGLEVIGDEAFSQCHRLGSIELPESLTSIGKGAFDDCYGLSRFCGKYASADQMSLVYGGRLISIVYKDLVSINIPEGVEVLDDRVLMGRSLLETVKLPESLTTIGKDVFWGCLNISRFEGKFASEDGKSLVKEGELIAYAPKNLTEIVLPEGLKRIRGGVFQFCHLLKSVTLPESLLTIEPGAFTYCPSLTKFAGKFASDDGKCLVVDNELIAVAPFGLQDFSVPEGVTMIHPNIFVFALELESVHLPESGCVTAIGDYAFNGCKSLTSINLPEGLVSIGDAAFVYCSGLNAVSFPSTVTTIGNSAFMNCTSLQGIELPDRALNIENYAFSDCSMLSEVRLPEALTEVPAGMFRNCTSLSSVYLPEGMTEIGSEAFMNCRSLASVRLPSTVQQLGYSAFENCSGMSSITLPDKLNYYYLDRVFNGCSGLSTVNLPDGFNFEGCDFASLFYGCNNISQINHKDAVDNGRYVMQNGQLMAVAPKGLTDIVIPDAVKKVHSNAFLNCRALRTVKMPQGMKVIDNGAFAGCSSLVSVEFAQQLTHVGSNAFKDCCSLKSLQIPESVKSIGSGAFYGCKGLSSFSWESAGEVTLGDEAFLGCRNLTSVRLPDGLARMSNSLFYKCTSLSTITLPKALNWIGVSAFGYCTGLTSIELPESVREIEDCAFDKCELLKQVRVLSPSLKMHTNVFDDNAWESELYLNEKLHDQLDGHIWGGSYWWKINFFDEKGNVLSPQS